jgi:hypothetical protein
MITTLRSAQIASSLACTAIAASVLFLSAHGPFFDPAAPAGQFRASTYYLVGDGRLQTVAGVLDAGKSEFTASDTEGVLVFGPYQTLDSGRYQVAWIGSAQKDSRPRFEVTSMKDGLIAVGNPRLAAGTRDAALQTLEFNVAHPVAGAEFRVLVGRGDAVSVHAVELTALAGLHEVGR